MSERSEYAMLGTWHACWARILTVVGYSWRNRENMNLWLWESLEDLQVKKHWKRLITQSYMLQVMKSCNRYQHMYYAALAFSIDPQIDRKDNDTFFQFCPRGVQFKVSTYIFRWCSFLTTKKSKGSSYTNQLATWHRWKSTKCPNPNSTVKRLPVIATVQQLWVMPWKDLQFTQKNGANPKQMCWTSQKLYHVAIT